MARARSVQGLALATVALLGFGGCALEWPVHEHDNWCGHAYLYGASVSSTPMDFAGSMAWQGPLYENQVRIGDPYRGNRPQPEGIAPWADHVETLTRPTPYAVWPRPEASEQDLGTER